MSRKILTDEERAERKRRAWDPNQFKKGKPGNESQWKRAAQALVGAPITDANVLAYCDVLGMTAVPANQRALVKARNTTLKNNSDALMGTSAAATAVGVKINAAFEILTEYLKSRME